MSFSATPLGEAPKSNGPFGQTSRTQPVLAKSHPQPRAAMTGAVTFGYAPRRPRLAIMGEFSAGKSTLTNLLMCDCALPTKVTATQLPPVWLSFGEADAYGETLNGERFAVNLDALGDIDLETTRCLRVFRPSEILQHCDLIDFPGISDPNMDSEVWQRLLPLADAALWCSHATQAWRQSEAAVWEDMPPQFFERSLLLLTRMDRLSSQRDRDRVIARVTRETRGLFRQIMPVSLLRALQAGDDDLAWRESGAEALSDTLLKMIDAIAADLTADEEALTPTAPAPSAASAQRTVTPEPEAHDPNRVRPRRVRPTLSASARPVAPVEPLFP